MPNSGHTDALISATGGPRGGLISYWVYLAAFDDMTLTARSGDLIVFCTTILVSGVHIISTNARGSKPNIIYGCHRCGLKVILEAVRSRNTRKHIKKIKLLYSRLK